jgi:hypothetical protein
MPSARMDVGFRGKSGRTGKLQNDANDPSLTITGTGIAARSKDGSFDLP